MINLVYSCTLYSIMVAVNINNLATYRVGLGFAFKPIDKNFVILSSYFVEVACIEANFI